MAQDVKFTIKTEDQASGQIKRLNTELRKLSKQTESSSKSVSNFSQQSQNASKSISSLGRNISKQKTIVSGLKNSFTKLNSSIERNRESIRSVRNVSGVAFAGIATAIGGAVNAFKNFEKQMAVVQGITGSTGKEFEEMTDLAKKMGATTVFTAVEAGKALEFLGMAGLDAQQSMAALPGALELAAASGLSLAESADIATNIMAQYGIEAENIGRVNDVLARTATSANTSVSEVAEAMKFLGPVTASFGVSLEESASALAVLANNGIKGSMAGQAFASSLLRITKPTEAMASSMKALNVELFDQQGQFVGITETIKQLEAGTKGLTDQEKAKHISTVFGIQSTKQWLTLLKEGSGELEGYTDSLENAEGAAKAMADTQIDTLDGSMKLLSSSISGLSIELGETFEPIVRKAVDRLSEIIGKVTERVDENPNLAKTIGVVAIGLTGFVTVATTIGLILPALTAGVATFGTVLGVILSPIGLVVLAIGALIAVGVLVVKHWDAIKAKAAELWAGISASFAAGGERVRAFFEEWGRLILGIATLGFSEVVLSVVKNWDKIKAFFVAGGESVKTSVSDFLLAIKNFFVNTWSNIVTGVSYLWQSIKNIFTTGAAELISQAFQRGSNLVNMIKDGILSGVKAVGDAVKKVADKIKGFLGFSSPTDEGPGANADKRAPNFIDMFAGGIEAGAGKVGKAVSDVAGVVKTGIDEIQQLGVDSAAQSAIEGLSPGGVQAPGVAGEPNQETTIAMENFRVKQDLRKREAEEKSAMMKKAVEQLKSYSTVLKDESTKNTELMVANNQKILNDYLLGLKKQVIATRQATTLIMQFYQEVIDILTVLINKARQASVYGVSVKNASERASRKDGGFVGTTSPMSGQIQKFQSGGIVAGQFGTDVVPANLTAGELVLNRAQQETLAPQLQGGGGQQVVVNINVSGNSFFGDDEEFAEKIGEQILENFKESTIFQAF